MYPVYFRKLLLNGYFRGLYLTVQARCILFGCRSTLSHWVIRRGDCPLVLGQHTCSLQWDCWWHIWPGIRQVHHNPVIRRYSWPLGCNSTLVWNGWYHRRFSPMFFCTVMPFTSNWRLLEVNVRGTWAWLLHWKGKSKVFYDLKCILTCMQGYVENNREVC